MHIGRLIARLNPTTVRFDIGAGGIPELTAQDVAAALGMVRNKLGRELLCRLWWPDGAAMTAHQLDSLLRDAQLKEWNRREASMYEALGRVACHEGSASLREAERMYANAHAKRWPKWIAKIEPLEIAPGYESVRRLVVEEIVHPRDCPPCHGRGHVMKSGLLTECTRCEGLGIVKYGPTWRSRRMGVKESTYRQTWDGPYEWLYQLATDALSDAEAELRKAVA